jgi:hypothetical protein
MEEFGVDRRHQCPAHLQRSTSESRSAVAGRAAPAVQLGRCADDAAAWRSGRLGQRRGSRHAWRSAMGAAGCRRGRSPRTAPDRHIGRGRRPRLAPVLYDPAPPERHRRRAAANDQAARPARIPGHREQHSSGSTPGATTCGQVSPKVSTARMMNRPSPVVRAACPGAINDRNPGRSMAISRACPASTVQVAVNASRLSGHVPSSRTCWARSSVSANRTVSPSMT